MNKKPVLHVWDLDEDGSIAIRHMVNDAVQAGIEVEAVWWFTMEIAAGASIPEACFSARCEWDF